MKRPFFLEPIKGIVVGAVVGVVVMMLLLLTVYSSVDPWHKAMIAFGLVTPFVSLGAFAGFLRGLIIELKNRRQDSP